MTVISGMAHIGVGRQEGGGGVGGGGESVAGGRLYLPLGTSSNAVFSVSDRNRFNSQDMLRQLLTEVWYHSQPY